MAQQWHRAAVLTGAGSHLLLHCGGSVDRTQVIDDTFSNRHGRDSTKYVVEFSSVTLSGRSKSPVRAHTRSSGGSSTAHAVAASYCSGGNKLVQMSTSMMSSPSAPRLWGKSSP